MKTVNLKTTYLRIIASMTISLAACEDFVNIDPPKTASVTASVFADDNTATSAIRGIYHELVNTGFANGTTSSVTFCAGTSSDELRSHTASLDEFFNNSLTTTNSSVLNSLWLATYKYIYYSNSAIEGLSRSSEVTTGTRRQLEGEAKFIRAFCHFYLASMFGDVPLVLSTDYRINSVMPRTQKGQVFEQVVQDLKEAQQLLSPNYQFTNGERVRITSGAASAFLARVYLQTEEWSLAESNASAVINNVALYKLVADLNAVFLKNSNEAILQFMPVLPGVNTSEAVYFVPASTTSVPQYVSLTSSFLGSFEPGDSRKTAWTGTYIFSGNTYSYPFKYKVYRAGQPVTEYSMVLRLAEQYLIRAEARARQGKLIEAVADLDVIRQRAGLPSLTTKLPSLTLDNVIAAIEQERRIELFTEWGHRWFDLKRWNKADQAFQGLKPNWSSSDALYPIPQSELNNDPNLGPQNPGY